MQISIKFQYEIPREEKIFFERELSRKQREEKIFFERELSRKQREEKNFFERDPMQKNNGIEKRRHP